EAHRRSDVRGRDRQHELLDLEQRRVRRVRHRAADHHTGDQGCDESRAGANPERRVRAQLHSGESRRRADAVVAAAHDRGASDRAGRCEVARNDAVDQEEQARRSEPQLSPGRAFDRQRGWIGLIAILIALAIVAVLAQTVLKTYGLLPGAQTSAKAGPRGPGVGASAEIDPTAATPAPSTPIDR